jgi:hypothetical protein
MKLLTPSLTLAALVAGFGLLSADRLGAQQAKGSFLDLEIENRELKMSLEQMLGDKKQLQDALAETQKTLADMRKNLAAASGESEIFKRQATELKLRIEALGLETAGGNSAKLEQRLLTAVSDIRILTDEKKKLSEAIVRLSEAASVYARTATGANAETRLALEAQIRNANMALGLSSSFAVEASPVPASISEGGVISVKDDLALVVMNLGSQHGVKVGMPFQVTRDKRIIGSVRVVDVREKIAGAYIQNLSSEKDRIKVGDHLRVDARQ